MSIGEGRKIHAIFTQDLVGDVNSAVPYFKIKGKQYDKWPDGTLLDVEKNVLEIQRGETNKDIYILFDFDNAFNNMIGDLTLSYSAGGLNGLGGPVETFDFVFTPTELQFQGPQNAIAKIGLDNISAEWVLIRLYKSDAPTIEEHAVKVVNISANYVLTYIDDI